MSSPACSRAYLILLLLGVFFELMAMFSALVDFLFGVVVAVVIILIEMYLLLFYVANVTNKRAKCKINPNLFSFLIASPHSDL